MVSVDNGGITKRWTGLENGMENGIENGMENVTENGKVVSTHINLMIFSFFLKIHFLLISLLLGKFNNV